MTRYNYSQRYDLLKKLEKCPTSFLKDRLCQLKCPIPADTVRQWLNKERDWIYLAAKNGLGDKYRLSKEQKENLLRVVSFTAEELKQSLVQSCCDGGDEDDIVENESKNIAVDSTAKSLLDQIGYKRTNSSLVEIVIFTLLKAKEGDVLWDTTRGQGKFQSEKSKKKLTIYNSDFFKNEKDSHEVQYENVQRVSVTYTMLVNSKTKVSI